ncbi:MAG: hypothetical protein HYZ53_18030 [Planctomycetes bacterium]|nr:hypothetical protein [Planctomycetota bacterium]
MRRKRSSTFGLAMSAFLCAVAAAAGRVQAEDAAQERLEADARAGRPLVAHVVVALCDNVHQGIVPVPAALGNGQDPATNLYWGARFGVKSHFAKVGWQRLSVAGAPEGGVLERIVFRRTVARPGGASATCVVVAEAWDGRRIRDAIGRFLSLSAGDPPAQIEASDADGQKVSVTAGGASHVVAYVGHDGLMEFAAPGVPGPGLGGPRRSAMVLACSSRAYFAAPVARAGAHALVLTTGLMAPEAYTLDAALLRFFGGGTPAEVRAAAAGAYATYQKCSLSAARRLFAGDP